MLYEDFCKGILEDDLKGKRVDVDEPVRKLT